MATSITMTKNTMRVVPRALFTKSLGLSGPVVVKGDVAVVTLVLTVVVLDNVVFLVDEAVVFEVVVAVVVDVLVVIGNDDVNVWVVVFLGDVVVFIDVVTLVVVTGGVLK